MFYVADVFDGYPDKVKWKFPTEEEFSNWLAAQSDHSLEGDMTLNRLEKYIQKAEKKDVTGS